MGRARAAKHPSATEQALRYLPAENASNVPLKPHGRGRQPRVTQPVPTKSGPRLWTLRLVRHHCILPMALVPAGGEQTKYLGEGPGPATEKEKAQPWNTSDYKPSTTGMPPHLGRSECHPFGAGLSSSGKWLQAKGGSQSEPDDLTWVWCHRQIPRKSNPKDS